MNTTRLLRGSTEHGVTTLRFNNPKKLNGWTTPMMDALKEALAFTATDPRTSAVILTGTDPYYSAGVNLGGSLELDHPRRLRQRIIEHNQALFESFLMFPKPLLAAINGPAIGAVVTSATLCDDIIASERATFSTPFTALGLAPEGCSSVLFAKLMGEDAAQRMLGPEGYRPTAAEAHQLGLIGHVVDHESLIPRAQHIARQWVREGRTRTFRGGLSLDELLRINLDESVVLADAFLSRPFLDGQARFLAKKRKRGPATLFRVLAATHPVWSTFS